jgi:RND superfamily putative drug exporter
MLTVAAAFGVLTVLFVGDNPPLGGAGKLDVVTVTGIFVVTFALSIDYQVFLLTRMREEYVRTQSSMSAIDFGISKTARVVTGAAAILVAVFIAFALSSFSMIQQLGIGLGTAVLIDATIVRLGLLPAVMKLAGDRTWWLPTWLDEKLPLLDTEGALFERDASHLRASGG